MIFNKVFVKVQTPLKKISLKLRTHISKIPRNIEDGSEVLTKKPRKNNFNLFQRRVLWQ